MNHIIKTSIFFTLLSFTTLALSVPITYTFEANSSYQQPFLPILNGPVMGSFQYDSETPSSNTVSSGIVNGAVVYDFAISGLMGSVNGNHFSDTSGAAVVGNDVFRAASNAPLPGTDFFLLSFDDINGPAQNFNGFSASDDTLGLLTLTNVRLYWIEIIFNVEPFLSDNNLTDTLPAFSGGRLALDFEDSNGDSNSLFYELQISAVNVNTPSVLFLFMTGLALIGIRSKKQLIK